MDIASDLLMLERGRNASFWYLTRLQKKTARRRMIPMSVSTEQVWEAFHLPLHQFICKRVPDEDTTEDLLQEVFLKIHRSIRILKGVKKLESWIYQITRHAIIDYYRHQKPTTT
jgi:DNA-directed RNA polymerase specialized sigma24 family protein